MTRTRALRTIALLAANVGSCVATGAAESPARQVRESPAYEKARGGPAPHICTSAHFALRWGDENNNNFKIDDAYLNQGEDLVLRIVIDKNLVEVFANDRQAAGAAAPYDPAKLAIRLFSQGGAVEVQEISAWKMKPSL